MLINNKNIWYWLSGAGILALALRLYHLTSTALWHDEAFSVLMVKYPLKEMLYRLTLDVHPPGYYLAFFGWDKLFGNSLFSLRFFSVIFGLLAIFAAYYLIKVAFKKTRLAYWALAAMAVSPFMIFYAQEGRMYSLGLFLLLAAAVCLWQAIKTKKVLCWILFIIFSAAACYTHYYLLFGVFALFLFLIYMIFKQENKAYLIKWTVGSIIGLIILYLPWIKYFYAQLSQVQESYWIPKMSLWSVPNTLVNLLSGGNWPIGEHNWYLGAIAIIAILYFLIQGSRYLVKVNKKAGVLILLSFVTPFVIAILLSLKQSLYLDRYFIFITPCYLIILVAGIYSLKSKLVKTVVMIFFCFTMLFSYLNFWADSDIKNKPGMAKAAEYINQNHQGDDKILITSSFVFFTFKYYNQTNQQPYLYAPGELSHFSGTALLSEKDITKDFNEFAGPGDAVWLINTTGFGNFQPVLPHNWQQEMQQQVFPDSNSVKGDILIDKYLVE